jgi:hypothetical protein
VKLRKNACDTCAVLSEAYGGEAMKTSSVSEWHKWFKEGHENVESDERSGCPRSHRTNENVEKVWNLVHPDICLNIRAMYVQLFRQRNRQILSHDLCMKNVLANTIP